VERANASKFQRRCERVAISLVSFSVDCRSCRNREERKAKKKNLVHFFWCGVGFIVDEKLDERKAE
jgi:hypothetical protein